MLRRWREDEVWVPESIWGYHVTSLPPQPPEAKASYPMLQRLMSRLEKTGYFIPDLSLGEAKNECSLCLSLPPQPQSCNNEATLSAPPLTTAGLCPLSVPCLCCVCVCLLTVVVHRFPCFCELCTSSPMLPSTTRDRHLLLLSGVCSVPVEA